VTNDESADMTQRIVSLLRSNRGIQGTKSAKAAGSMSSSFRGARSASPESIRPVLIFLQ
jgi:hypothetical protein